MQIEPTAVGSFYWEKNSSILILHRGVAYSVRCVHGGTKAPPYNPTSSDFIRKADFTTTLCVALRRLSTIRFIPVRSWGHSYRLLEVV